ncbi:hypothetical protein Dimus_015146 [Dionaea muscipula]
MIVTHLKKKDVVKSKVRGVDLEFDHEKLATILGVPGKNEICEYIKEVWEESKYTKPLEITRRFANDDTIVKARRVKSVEMKPSQRFIHFLVMKNVIPRFGKRDTTSFMDLGYMDHLTARRLVNLPRVMMRHMSYVISIKDHELQYGDWLTMVFEAFGVPLVDKKGEEPKRYDFFEETFLTMCKLTRENGIWWIGSGENRRRDDDEVAPEEEAEDEDEGNKDDFDWEAVIDEATVEGESGSGEKFYDAEEEAQGSPELHDEIPAEATPDHELPYGDWLTLVFEAFGVPLVIKKGEEPKKYDFFEDTFLTMCKLTREDGIWWIGSGENRRRDDDEVAPEEEAEGEDEGNRVDFDREAIIDEATVEGESGSGEKFYDAEEEAQGSPKRSRRFQRMLHPDRLSRRTRA